jgi:hypothetical protein
MKGSLLILIVGLIFSTQAHIEVRTFTEIVFSIENKLKAI